MSAVVLSAVLGACPSSPQGSGFTVNGKDSGGGGFVGGEAGGNNGNNNNGNNNQNTGMLGTGNTDAGQQYSDAGLMGDGPIDTTPPCDMISAVDDPNASSFAKAIGICTTSAGAGYGLVSATYSNGFGRTTAPAAGQWGLLPNFGSAIMPREGSSIGAISSGYARSYDDSQGTQLNTMNDPFYGGGEDGDFVNSSPDGPRADRSTRPAQPPTGTRRAHRAARRARSSTTWST